MIPVCRRCHGAAAVAGDLLRTALLAKLAVDLGDPTLARRAAVEAAGHARLLAGSHVPACCEDGEVRTRPVDGRTLGDLLAELYPPAAVLEVEDAHEADVHDDEADDADDAGPPSVAS